MTRNYYIHIWCPPGCQRPHSWTMFFTPKSYEGLPVLSHDTRPQSQIPPEPALSPERLSCLLPPGVDLDLRDDSPRFHHWPLSYQQPINSTAQPFSSSYHSFPSPVLPLKKQPAPQTFGPIARPNQAMFLQLINHPSSSHASSSRRPRHFCILCCNNGRHCELCRSSPPPEHTQWKRTPQMFPRPEIRSSGRDDSDAVNNASRGDEYSTTAEYGSVEGQPTEEEHHTEESDSCSDTDTLVEGDDGAESASGAGLGLFVKGTSGS